MRKRVFIERTRNEEKKNQKRRPKEEIFAKRTTKQLNHLMQNFGKILGLR